MLVPPESSSAVLVMISSKSVSICNRSRARLVDSSRNRTFSRGYQNLMHSYGGLLEHRGSNLALLKSTFNAENFICRLSWSISSDFDAVYSWNVYGSHKSQKHSLKSPILWFKVVQGHRCWYPLKARQQCLLWCAASLCLSTVLVHGSRNRAFWRGYPNLMPSYGRLVEPSGSNLTPLKSTV